MNVMDDAQSKPVSILLVEDDDGDAKSVLRAFKKARVANPIVRALDGVEALDIMKGRDPDHPIKKPYFVLIDLNLPRMNGLELIDHIRQDDELKDLVLFVLTLSKRDEDITAAYAQNIAGYITKEKAGDDFLNLVELLDCYWRIVELPHGVAS